LAAPGRRRAASPRRQHERPLVDRDPVGAGEAIDAPDVLAPAVSGRARVAEAGDRIAELTRGLEARGPDDVVLAAPDRIDHALDADHAGDASLHAPVLAA